jgi:hypothetical protein
MSEINTSYHIAIGTAEAAITVSLTTGTLKPTPLTVPAPIGQPISDEARDEIVCWIAGKIASHLDLLDL